MVLEKHVGKKQINRIDINNIVKVVGRIMKVTEKSILGKGRNMEIALARQICMFIAKEKTSLSLASIGKQIGGRDHSTVIHAHKTIKKKLNKEIELQQIINNIKNQLD